LTAGLSIASIPAHAERQPAVQSRNADVNGTKIHYLIAGKGEPILLLHGYAQNSHMGPPDGLLFRSAPLMQRVGEGDAGGSPLRQC
jgi:hypothetical protein